MFPKSFLLVICLILELVGISVFLKGFFPVKSSITGYAKTSDHKPEPSAGNNSELPNLSRATFDKLIFILIDAVRTDFVFPKDNEVKMPFLNKLLHRSDALGFLTRGHPPTVTLPRIKAITTGSIPGFVDVVLNFNSKELREDNLISQFHRSGRRLVFYGDDTWMKLFPEHFIRSDGTTSFFVTDYTEVDDNVTRHIGQEMTRQDWDVMILHYLGLDHIGHIAGPTSPLITPKLLEMDKIIQEIYNKLFTEEGSSNNLLLVCGDHGMSDQGGHGGSSYSEVMTPLVLASPLLSQTPSSLPSQVEQIDLAVTLAVLMGVPIPKNSLGSIIPTAVAGFTMRQQLSVFYQNSQQLLSVVKQNSPLYEQDVGYVNLQRAIQSHQNWLTSYETNTDSADSLHKQGQKILTLYRSAMLSMRKKVESTLSQYDLHAMAAGITLLLVVLLCLLCGSVMEENRLINLTELRYLILMMSSFFVLVMSHTVVCTSMHHSQLLCSTSLSSIIIMTLVLITVSILLPECLNLAYYTEMFYKVKKIDLLEKVLLLGIVFHTLSLCSSSFVEEEHQTWYFYTVTMNIVLLVKTVLPSVLPVKKISSRDGDSFEKKSAENGGKHPHFKSDEKHKITTDIIRNSDEDSLQIRENHAHAEHLAETKDKSNSKSGLVRSCVCAGVVLVCSRILRTWNQTGDQWKHLPDVGDWLVRPENKEVLSLLVAVSLTTICIVKNFYHSRVFHFIFCTACAGIYYFRAVNGALCLPWINTTTVSKGITEARFVYLLIFLQIVYVFWVLSKSSKSPVFLKTALSCLLSAWIVLSLLLVRPHNIMYVTMVVVQEMCVLHVINGGNITHLTVTLFHLWMGQAAFFYQGNSNSLSTVDVSAGYVGLEEYNPLIIGALMGAATYTGPVLWLISLIKNLACICCETHEKMSRYWEAVLSAGYILAVCRALPVAGYTALCTLQRYHLFVWTVFSPKLLYEGMFTVVLTVFVMVILTLRTSLRSAHNDVVNTFQTSGTFS